MNEPYRKSINLKVNLEDLVKEEEAIYRIFEYINQRRPLASTFCAKWWKITQNSSVKEMQSFFEEEVSKKLI